MSDDGRIEIVTYSIAEAVRENPGPRAPFLPFRFLPRPLPFPRSFYSKMEAPPARRRAAPAASPPYTRPSPDVPTRR